MERKVLDTNEVEDLKKKEMIRYYMRMVEEEPEDHDEFFDSILTNDYFRIKIDLNRLLKLLKTLVADKTTDIRLLKNEIFGSENLAFVDSTKGKEVAKGSGDLYIRTYFTPKHKEETLKNEITLYTNLFKVKLNPKNPTHSVFMKKMIDMRSSPILKHKEGNDSETNIKTFIELLKLTFNMKSKLKFDELAEAGNTYSFGKMIKSEAPSLSRQVSGASDISTASSIRDTKSDFFENIEKLNAKRYDFYKDNINYFTQILIRNTPQGLATYNDWYEEFVDGYYFEGYYVLWEPLKKYLDKYMFDSAIEDLLDKEYEEGLDGEPDIINLYMQTIIPKKQIEDIEKGNILLLTTYFCLTLSLEDDIDFLEDLPLMYPKDLYETKSKVKEFKQVMKQIYLKDTEIGDLEIDSDVEDDDNVVRKYADNDTDSDDNRFDSKTRKVIYKYFDFVRSNREVILEENPKFKDEKRDFIEKLIELYSVVNVKFKLLSDKFDYELVDITETLLDYLGKTNAEIFTNEEILDDYIDIQIEKEDEKELLDFYNKFLDLVRESAEVVVEEFPKLASVLDKEAPMKIKLVKELGKKMIDIFSSQNVSLKEKIKKQKKILMSLFGIYVIDKDLTNEEIIEREDMQPYSEELIEREIVYDDSDDDDDEEEILDYDENLYEKYGFDSKTRKVIYEYFDFVRSNREVILKGNPEFKDKKQDFIQKLIELYSDVNVKFKLLSDKFDYELNDITETLLDYLGKTNAEIFTNEEILTDYIDIQIEKEDEDSIIEKEDEKEILDFYNKFLDLVRKNVEIVVVLFPELASVLDIKYKRSKKLEKELGEKMIDIFSSQNVSLKEKIKKQKKILMSVFTIYVFDRDLTNKEIIDIEFDNNDDDTDDDTDDD